MRACGTQMLSSPLGNKKVGTGQCQWDITHLLAAIATQRQVRGIHQFTAVRNLAHLALAVG